MCFAIDGTQLDRLTSDMLDDTEQDYWLFFFMRCSLTLGSLSEDDIADGFNNLLNDSDGLINDLKYVTLTDT